MEVRLECGHDVDVVDGVRLWCYYDTSFGVVATVGTDGWHDFVMDGSPYKAAGSRGYYNAQRLACVGCGEVELRRRVNDPLLRVGGWELFKAAEVRA